MTTYCITVAYGDKLRTFQRAVLADSEREAVDKIVREHVARVENGHAPPELKLKPRPPTSSMDTLTQAEIARASGFTGSVCECGSFRMVRTGTCEQCQDCFKPSGGCS